MSLKESEAKRGSVEEKLRRQLDLTRAITNSLAEGVCMIDREGSITFLNRAAEESLGWKESELLGKHMHAAIHFQHADGTPFPAAECPLLNVRESGVSYRTEDDVFTRKDGSVVPVAYTASPVLTDGRATGAVIAFRDITERKRVETEARASERRFRMLTDAVPQLVWATDASGSHFYYNRRWYEFTGLTEEESLGLGFTNALHPEDRERTLRRWESAWRDGEGYEIEYRFYSRPRDEYRWFLTRAVPVRDDAGRVVQWVGTCTDIEEQKRMEEALAALNLERERLLEEVSTPVVPVWHGVLVLPIIGSLDTARMQKATDAALSEVRRTGAWACIIDITGARLADSHAVANLTNLVRALRLVGAEATVTGVGPHAAKSLVSLGLDLQGMRTRRTLAQALSSIIKRAPARARNGNG